MTAALTASQKAKLNKMNRAAQNVSLGNMLENVGMLASGSLSVSDAQANASTVIITTGLATVGGFIFDARRSGSPLNLYLNVVAGSVTAGTIVALRATNNSASAITINDKYSYIAFK
jgi:hypothetical protein